MDENPIWQVLNALSRGGSRLPTPPPAPSIPIAPAYRPPIGQIEPGNIDLRKQPKVPNPHGGTSTVYSFSVNFGGKEYLLPMVMPDGRLLDEETAIQEFRRTGRHLGVFDSPDNATAFARQLHEEYEGGKYGR